MPTVRGSRRALFARAALQAGRSRSWKMRSLHEQERKSRWAECVWLLGGACDQGSTGILLRWPIHGQHAGEPPGRHTLLRHASWREALIGTHPSADNGFSARERHDAIAWPEQEGEAHCVVTG
jgi:hypothetical protein